MPTFATTGSQCYVYFEVTQRGRKDTYVSKHYLSRKGDRNVSLSVNPPLLLSEDVKFEFYTKQKFGEQLWGNSKMKFARSGEKVFHFWLNTFFVDMELEGGLAHDLTVRFTKFTKSHRGKLPHLIQLTNHIFKISIFTKFTFSKSHFSQNSHFFNNLVT